MAATFPRKMLDETATWKESSVGEVDLRSDPHASQESVAAVLRFLVADARSEYDTVWGVVEEFGFSLFLGSTGRI